MRIDALTLEGFRNYREQRMAFDPRCNVICGENAQGKTNLLEAVVYLAWGRSPRTRSDRELIGFEREGALLRGEIFSRERSFVTEVQLLRGARRRMTVNGVPAKRAAELSAVLSTVYFCPEDLLLIRAGAVARRRFMDDALCQLRPRYAELLTEYERLCAHKTRILKESQERPGLREVLPEFDSGLIRTGSGLIHYRARFCQRLAEVAALTHADCSGGREEFSLTYQTVSTVTDPMAPVERLQAELAAHMESHRSAEWAVKQCLSGPHKDDMQVLLDGRPARQFGSQGQTRTAALSLKLAERELYQAATGEYPVLLLDDVLSELDARRQEFVLNRIGSGQVFISCCEEDKTERLLGGRVVKIRGGQVVE